MIDIPNGWRELLNGEVIKPGDMLSKLGENPFIPAKKSVGKKYRDNTVLSKQTIVITPITSQTAEAKPVEWFENNFVVDVSNLSYEETLAIHQIVKSEKQDFNHIKPISCRASCSFFFHAIYKETLFSDLKIRNAFSPFRNERVVTLADFLAHFDKNKRFEKLSLKRFSIKTMLKVVPKPFKYFSN